MNKKAITSTIGVIVLGALGSGLWELTKPMLGWAWDALITISIFGLDSLKDGMYAQAALSLGRPVGLSVAVQGLAALIALPSIFVIRSISIACAPKRYSFHQHAQLFLMAMSITMLIVASRTSYITSLAYYCERLEIIAAPLISDTALKQHRAKFAQIKSRKEFIQEVEALQSEIKRAGGSPPTTDFF